MIRIAAALVLTLASAQAHALGGALDTTLGTDGISQVLDSTNDLNFVFARAPDGKFVIVRNRADGITVMRRLADGMPDPTFGTGGEITHGRAAPTNSPIRIVPLAVKRIAFQGTKILLAGEATSACGTPGIARLDANGGVDITFADRGWSTPVRRMALVPSCSYGEHVAIADLRQLPDGRIAMAATTTLTETAGEGDVILARWSSQGVHDFAYNEDRGNAAGFRWRGDPGGARIFADGAVAMVYNQQVSGRWRAVYSKVAPDGTRAAGGNGLVLAVPEALTLSPMAAVIEEGGEVLLVNRDVPNGTIAVARFRGTALVGAYGTGGIARIPLGHPTYVRFPLATPDGGTLLLADSQNSIVDGRNDAIVMLKLDATGRLEPSFGVSGRTDLSTSALTEFPHQATIDADGYLALFGRTTFRSGGDARYNFYHARVQAVPDIVEFQNTILQHYFVTYDNAEARGIDAGAAGAGWVRTGLSFRPGGPASVCRFQGTPGIGPNSHFYTADLEECALVKAQSGWTYEGLGFNVTPPADGLCHTLRPVYRLYNNRFAQNDSNHRFLSNDALIESMVTLGWIYEGIVFCTPR